MRKFNRILMVMVVAISMIFGGQHISWGIDKGNYIKADAEIKTSDIQDDIEFVGKAEKNKEVLKKFQITSDIEQFALISVRIDNGDDDIDNGICGYINVDCDNSEDLEYASRDRYYFGNSDITRSLVLGKGEHTISMLWQEDVDYTIHITFDNMCKNKNLDNLIYYEQESYEEGLFEFNIKEKKKVNLSVYGYNLTSDFEDEFEEIDDNGSWIYFGTKKEYEQDTEDTYLYDSYDDCKRYYRFGDICHGEYSRTVVLNPGSYVLRITSPYDNVEVAVQDVSVAAMNVEFSNNKSVSVLENKIVKLKYSVLPKDTTNKALVWKSSNNKIAKVITNGTQCVSIKGINAGKCELSSILKDGTKITANIIVKERKPKLNYAKKSLLLGETVKLKLNYAKKAVSFSTSNKKIATVTKNGTVKAKNRGKCTIFVKCGKKKYNCKITVKKTNPNFYACLYDYNMRDNYFTVKFKNVGKTSIKIKQGIKVIDIDYKSFDRNVYMKRGITINPGKTKYVRFYVKGRSTWFVYSDFTLYYKFVFDHKEHEGHVWDEDSVYKEKGGWYSTYWIRNEEEYEEWIL